MLGGPRRWGRFFGAGRGRCEPTPGDGWDSRRLPVGVGQGTDEFGTTRKTGYLGDSAVKAANGASGGRRNRVGDGDPFHTGLEDRHGCLRRQLLHPHRLGVSAAGERHLPASTGVMQPPHRSRWGDQPALPVLLDQGDRGRARFAATTTGNRQQHRRARCQTKTKQQAHQGIRNAPRVV
jgi:hypothetical protein